MFTLNINAQHDHGSHTNMEHSHKTKSPNGGEIHDVGKYHLEIVFDKMNAKEQFKIYLLSSSLKSINDADFSGSMKIKYKNGKEEILTFENQTGFLVATISDAVSSFDAVITVKYKSKEYTTTYFYKGL